MDVQRKLRPRAKRVGAYLAIVVFLTMFIPTPYTIQAPGPTFDTLEQVEAEGTTHDMVEIDGAETYPTKGRLDLTTISVSGPPTSSSLVLEVLFHALQPYPAITPAELLYPPETTGDEVRNQNAEAMVDSQSWAVAAALEHLDKDYMQRLFALDFTEDSPARGILEPNDEIVSVNGTEITGHGQLVNTIQDAQGEPVEMTIRRNGAEQTHTIPVAQGEDGTYQVGVFLDSEFEFPIDVDIFLEDVGGPSAGLMFTLALIDRMTEESVADGRHIAGTGTIDPDGTVGPIGGIQQKVTAAASEGASIFLAPELNCEEITHVPGGMTVYSVDTLDTAIEILDAPEGEMNYPTCS
ncbi:MAG: PDZ domain-containing protein [Yaniella sp.]|uniref:YlbL family protein n=1 Tax=Yaniella sp. TaxID=2773929 RepID=UPI002647C730|nr:S16 family serine protease [Yaniella sp.]MDN5730884.1 PDZ domain-containing protein [Yaniella sp.]MDN5888377.1 PDZ domain-containing protein [Yaniella sp.]MDN5911354.1 PDZ domain-containing protein [Yaniella sp.]MDN6147326.1 PDZ domain-containing protein [Yaniella sp.]MDN6149902.1 PDZ domain-containing protein [Yaniella sp.]